MTLNTDNRTVSGTTLLKEIDLVKNTFGFTDEDIKGWKDMRQRRHFWTRCQGEHTDAVHIAGTAP